jgi:hypothetical protein
LVFWLYNAEKINKGFNRTAAIGSY